MEQQEEMIVNDDLFTTKFEFVIMQCLGCESRFAVPSGTYIRDYILGPLHSYTKCPHCHENGVLPNLNMEIKQSRELHYLHLLAMHSIYHPDCEYYNNPNNGMLRAPECTTQDPEFGE